MTRRFGETIGQHVRVRVCAGRRLAVGVVGAVGVGLVGGCASGPSASQVRVYNDSAGAVKLSVWSDGAVREQLRLSEGEHVELAKGEAFRKTLGDAEPGAQDRVVLAAYATDADVSSAQWLRLSPPGPYTARIFGEWPNLRLQRVVEGEDPQRMQRTVGPRPAPIGGIGR